MSIMVTYGPKFLEDNVVRELCKNDLMAIRIPASKGQPLQQLEQIAKDLPNDIRIVVDIPGEKHRLNNDDILVLTEGEILNFEKENTEIQGTKLSLFPLFDELFSSGEVLIAGDGETAFEVICDTREYTSVKVLKSARLGPRKGVTPLNYKRGIKTMTECDYQILDCLIDSRIKGIMISFVEDSNVIKNLREFIWSKYKREVTVYSKIETELGIENLEKIEEVSDYVVLGRGDLLITSGEEKFPVLQEKFLAKVLNKERAIIATGIARSIGKGYYMDKGELSFLYHIVKLGYTNVLLTGETAALGNPIHVYDKISQLITSYSL